MVEKEIFIGQSKLRSVPREVTGEYVELDGGMYYRISNYDRMKPFFMTLVSHADHWMFIASTGGLTAGRVDENHALFPYYTDDKITEASETTGSKTMLLVEQENRKMYWEPFSSKYDGLYSVRRNLYKNFYGNIIHFEEINEDLKLIFRYSWQFSDKYGFIKKSAILNTDHVPVKMEVLDGIRNIVPPGVTSALQNEKSNLVRAYKKNELDLSTGLGLFSLSSIIVDKPAPSESLLTTSVWSSGLDPAHYLLSDRQLSRFATGNSIETEEDIRAENGCYFLHADLVLEPGLTKNWYTVADIDQNHSEVIGLIQALKENKDKVQMDLISDIEEGQVELARLVGLADGFQLTGDALSTGRHYTNVLFNIMRGGIFDTQYRIETKDLADFIRHSNKMLYRTFGIFLAGLPSSIDYHDLLDRMKQQGDADLIRLGLEYLPLSFSRRHGDPSRPWNKFSIRIKNQDGGRIQHYEGNWRDIFQNWEALAFSFPSYIESMISKFVNASTVDGYNPYRISSDGIDWEVIDPEDPWSFIGYWGDHQIIYLLKFLELSERFHPGKLQDFLNLPYFVYAHIPYRIKSYSEIIQNPKDTIDYDFQLAERIDSQVDKTGSDGKLIRNEKGELVHATLTEKLLVSLLAKLSNFIPEAGIWLNTQRPEWNDANNALVGNGASMVTLYYLRRFVNFCIVLFTQSKDKSYQLHAPVHEFFFEVYQCFHENKSSLDDGFNDQNRRDMMDQLGVAGENYRSQVYQSGMNAGKSSIENSKLLEFFTLTLDYLDQTIRVNKRKDGLYHAYNLIKIGEQNTSILHLYEMLEGQVAVLSSGLLSGEEVLAVLDHLMRSAMFRSDQSSYMLYPDRILPRFLEKNNIPADFIRKSRLASELSDKGDKTLLEKDELGGYHFNGSFKNTDDLKEVLDTLKNTEYRKWVIQEFDDYVAVFEEMFNHRSFTGRSGSFFGYEGLGSIYWHMVSKLLLAVQECIFALPETPGADNLKRRLLDHYYKIRNGIGIIKSPEQYGAFPTDPYSHTPASRGVQQPGMTGQVKEDIINRWAELGLVIRQGEMSFNPLILEDREFLQEKKTFEYFDPDGLKQRILVHPDELAFTFCQVPVIYALHDKNSIEITYSDGAMETRDGLSLSRSISHEIFRRTGKIKQIRVHITR